MSGNDSSKSGHDAVDEVAFDDRLPSQLLVKSKHSDAMLEKSPEELAPGFLMHGCSPHGQGVASRRII